MNTSRKIKSLILGFSITLATFACNTGPKELVNYKGSDYRLKLEVSNNFSLIRHSKTSFTANDVILENVPLKDCLPQLLNIDKSLIQFMDPEKGDLLISATYEDFNTLRYSENSKNGYIKDHEEKTKETKKAFLLELKKALNFTVVEKVSPTDKYFQLILKDTVMNENQNSKLKNNPNTHSSITQWSNTLLVKNASITEIAAGLSESYEEEGKFFAIKNNKNRYTINIKNIPFNQLNAHLEKEIGLSFVPLNERKSSLRISKIVFND